MVKNRIKGLIFHWTDSGPGTKVATVRAWHLARGFKDIGYNWLIEHPTDNPNATQWGHLCKFGRRMDEDLYLEDKEVGAHTLHYNQWFAGIAVVSGPRSPLHPLQREAVIQIAHTLQKRYQLPPESILGHRDKNATQCPGDEIYSIIQALREGRL